MKTAWKHKTSLGFRVSPPPEAERSDWEEIDTGKLEVAERVALRIEQIGDEFCARMASLERQIDTLKAQNLAHGTVAGTPAAPKPVSFCKLFRAIGTGDWSKAEYERSVVGSDEALAIKQRAMGSNVDASGGYVVPPQYLASEFIPLLRAKTVLDKCGARFLMNLQGAPIILPKQTGGATAYWVAENAAITESALTLGQLTLNPRELGGMVIASNILLMQADPSAEQMIQNDLAKVLALKLDLAGLKGTGTDGQPLGVYYTSGITSSALTGAIVSTVFTMKSLLEVADVDMTDPAAALILHPTGWNKLRTVAAAAGTPKVYAGVGHSVVDEACDMKVFKSTQLAAADALVGLWSELIIANWAGIVFAASQHTSDAFAKNQTYMRAIMLVDVGVRQPTAFCKNTVFGTRERILRASGEKETNMKFQGNKYIKVVHALDAKDHAATVSSAAIDTRGFDEALVILNCGVSTQTASGTAFVMESDSSTAASFAHIAGSSFTVMHATSATKASQILSIDLHAGRKRYLRVKYTTATEDKNALSADVLLFGAGVLPVTASATDKGRI